jgi:hypothetical protein
MLMIMKKSAAAYASGWYMSSPERLLRGNSLRHYPCQRANRKSSLSVRFDGKHTRDSALQKLFFYWTRRGEESAFPLVFQEEQIPPLRGPTRQNAARKKKSGRFARDDNVD